MLSNVLLTATPAIVMILFHNFGAFRIMILLSLRVILMSQISTGSHCVVIHLTLLFDYNLSEVIQITNTGGNILDVVVTNTPEAVFNVNVASLSPLRSDHIAVTFRLSYVPVTSSSSAKSLFDYSKADWNYLSTFSITTYDLLLIMILFGSHSRTFSCPPFICMFLW